LTNKSDTASSDLLDYFRRFYAQLPHRRKRHFWSLAALMLIVAFIETATVGLISFYAATISDPASVLKYAYFNTIQSFFGHDVVFTRTSLIGWLSLAVIAAVLSKNALRGFFVYTVSRYSARLEAFFGHRLLETFLLKPYSWHLQQNSADLVQSVMWRTFLGRNFVTPSLNILSEASVLLVLLCALLIVEPLVFVLFVVVQGGATLLLYRQMKKKLDQSASRCKEKDRDINREVTRAIHGFKDVKITGTAGYFVDQFDQRANPYARDFSRQQFWREAPLLTLETVGFVLVCGAILIMLFGLGYSPLAITGVTALLAVTAWRTLPALNRVVASSTTIRTALPYVATLLPFLESSQQEQISAVEEKALDFNRSIEFHNVSFAYPETDGRKVVDNFNLTIRAGQTIGIMGASGCGKSTLIDLLVGLLPPDCGRILIDGQPLAPENVAAWANNIGYVPQFPYIFDGSIAANIAFGIPSQQIDQQRVLDVCRQAAIDFLDQLPAGVDSIIGERGIRLSGGQRQRIAIARALYRQPKLLIFDEATSALDEIKDHEIRQLIAKLKGKMTLVVVSHRKSTVEGCDVVIDIAA